MKTEMTRYSKNPDKSNRKNTLFTIRDGDNVFFGIARCNRFVGDTFRKSQGQMIAKARAIRAKIDFDTMPAELGMPPFLTHANGLRGFCDKANIVELLQYFESIDDIMREEAKSGG